MFTYIGLNAMNQSISFAKEIKEKYPKAIVAAVACDCDIEKKKISLSKAVAKNKVNHIVFCRICGGVTDMDIIVRSLIGEWEKKV